MSEYSLSEYSILIISVSEPSVLCVSESGVLEFNESKSSILEWEYSESETIVAEYSVWESESPVFLRLVCQSQECKNQVSQSLCSVSESNVSCVRIQ